MDILSVSRIDCEESPRDNETINSTLSAPAGGGEQIRDQAL
jgi:hypothetical protein